MRQSDAAAVQHQVAPPAKREVFFSRAARRLFLALALACALGARRGYFVHGVDALLHKLQQLHFYAAAILHGQQLHGGGKRGRKFQKIQDEPVFGWHWRVDLCLSGDGQRPMHKPGSADVEGRGDLLCRVQAKMGLA